MVNKEPNMCEYGLSGEIKGRAVKEEMVKLELHNFLAMES